MARKAVVFSVVVALCLGLSGPAMVVAAAAAGFRNHIDSHAAVLEIVMLGYTLGMMGAAILVFHWLTNRWLNSTRSPDAIKLRFPARGSVFTVGAFAVATLPLTGRFVTEFIANP